MNENNEWKQYKVDKVDKIKCNCSNCNKELYKTPSQLRKSKSGNTFCSKSCAVSYNNSHYRTGTNNPNWKDGTSYSKIHTKIAHRTYVDKCAICGLDEECILEVHHIDENHENNDIDNLIILCANCHARVHRGGYIITEDIKLNREIKI